MPLRLITGPANAGKTGEVIKEAREAALAGQSPVLVVPHLADVRRLERELSGKTPLGIRVVTLSQLSQDLWALHGDGRRIVDAYTRDALLRRALAEDPGVDLGHVADTPGFRRLLARLAAASSTEPPDVVPTSGSAAAVGSLLRWYRRLLGELGLVEPGWLPDLIADISPELEGPVGVLRFDAFRPQALRLVRGLARTNRVSIALTWARDLAATRANDGAAAYLQGIADEHVALEEEPTSGEIRRLAEGLFSGLRGQRSEGQVILGLASGGEAEVALIARLLAKEIGGGVAPERVVVAFRDAARRVDALDAALLSYSVSAVFDVSAPLLGTQFGRAWHALISLAAGRGGRAEALTYLTSPYSNVARTCVDMLDQDWRRSRALEPSNLLASMAARGGHGAGLIEMVRVLGKKGLSRATLPEWQKLAGAMLAARTNGSPGQEVSRALARDAAAHQAINRVLAEIARYSDRPVAPAEVLSSFAEVRVREAGEETTGSVLVCDFNRVGARRFDVVVLAGLTEDEVSAAPRDTLEQELRAEAAGELEPEQIDQLRLEFYSLVSRARSRVYLVRQEADSEGRDRRASVLWEDAIEVYRTVGASVEDELAAPPPTERIARSDIEQLAPALTTSRRAARSQASGLRLREPNRDAVTSVNGLRALANATVFSATEIETYLACPYRWFYERVVRPEEIDKALDARELGSRAHALLAAFYRKLPETGRRRVTADTLGECLRVFEDVVSDAPWKQGRADGLSEELAAARAVQWARNVVGQDASFLPDFTPEHVELSFGDESPFHFADHAFHGRIDRVDASGSSVFVTDYKSSRQVTGLSKFEAEGKVQAVIYASAAASLTGSPVCGSVYRSMRSGRLRGLWRADLLGDMPAGMCEDDALSAEGYAQLVARTEERVALAIDRMRAGVIPRVPAVKGACAFCALSAACEGARL